MKILITTLILTLSFNTYSQQMDAIKNDEIEQFEKHLYEKSSFLFKKKEMISKRNKDFAFPWSKPFLSENELMKYLRILEKNSSIKIENDSFGERQLCLNMYK